MLYLFLHVQVVLNDDDGLVVQGLGLQFADEVVLLLATGCWLLAFCCWLLAVEIDISGILAVVGGQCQREA